MPYNTYIVNISHLRPTGPLQLPSLRAAISISRFERHEEWLRFSRVMICRAPCHHLTFPNMSGWGVSWGNLHGVTKNRWGGKGGGALSLSTSNTKVLKKSRKLDKKSEFESFIFSGQIGQEMPGSKVLKNDSHTCS